MANIETAKTLEVANPVDMNIDYIEGLSEYESFFEGIYSRSLLYHLFLYDAPSLIVKTRIAGEHISRLIALQRCNNYHDEMKLFDVINLLYEEGLINELTKGVMHSLRIYGNTTLHNPNNLLGHEKSIARIVCSSLLFYLSVLKDDELLQGIGELHD